MSDEFNLVNDLAESRAQVYGAYADFFSGNGSSGFAGNWSELVRYQTGVEALLEMTSGPAPEPLPEPEEDDAAGTGSGSGRISMACSS